MMNSERENPGEIYRGNPTKSDQIRV